MATVPSNLNFPTKNQIPDHAILDFYNKQTYLGNQFIYSVGSYTPGVTTEVAYLYLLNPSSNKKSLFQNIAKLSVLTASQAAVVRLYSDPNVSAAGTSQTPLNMRPANSNLATATLFSTPTVTSNGTLLYTLSASPGISDTNSLGLLPILDPGQSVLITVQASSTSTAVSLNFGFYEL